MTISLAEPPGIREGITDTDFRVPVESMTTGRTVMLSALPKPLQEMRFPFTDGELVLVGDIDPRLWLAPTAQALVDLLDLPAGWDSYGARPVDRRHVDAALRVLLLIMRHNTPAPSVVPTNRGGVQLEWHTGGIDLEIETLSTQELLVSFEDSTTGDEWEHKISSDLTRLVKCIARLTPQG